jgi:hypothetical protein
MWHRRTIFGAIGLAAAALIALALFAVGGGGSGTSASGANAADRKAWTGPPTPVQRQARQQELAAALGKKLGKTGTEVRDAFQAVLKDHLDADVKAGRMTQEQEDSLLACIKTAACPPLLAGPPPGVRHHGGEPPHPPLHPRERLGKLADELGAKLGVSGDKVRQAMKELALERVDAAVKAGDLTQQQADRIKSCINGGSCPRPHFFRGGLRHFGGPMGRHHFGGPMGPPPMGGPPPGEIGP